MDRQRLKELHRLAGLKYDQGEAETLLKDLVALEKLAAGLPPVSDSMANTAKTLLKNISSGQRLEMDRTIEEANAPQKTDGFYEIPPTVSKGGGDSS